MWGGHVGSVFAMAVWDELRQALGHLMREQPGTLLEFPDPASERGQPPPFLIRLAPSGLAVAKDLHLRFGDDVLLTVGYLPYPPDRQPDPVLEALTRQLPGEPLDPRETDVRLDGPATVRSGQTLHHGLLVSNLTDLELTVATNGQVTAAVVDSQTGLIVGGFAGAQTLVGVDFHVVPGATERIPLLIGTASVVPDLGYTVPPGTWGIQVPLDLQRDGHTRGARRTPVLPLTITA
jgi:hypothetical protein